jgi:hypothetical protein
MINILNQDKINIVIKIKVESICNVMPRRPLNRPDKKTELIQIMVAPQEKAAFDAWCAANSTTMSEILRQEMAPYVAKGMELQQQTAS